MTDDLALPDDENQNPFFDQEALREVIEKATDVLRPIGLSVIPDSIAAMVDPQSGRMMINFAAQLRPSAKKKLTEDREAREQFNMMMAKNHEEMIKDRAEDIRKTLTGDPSTWFDEPEDECSHERRHPDGFCLDCGHGMEDE